MNGITFVIFAMMDSYSGMDMYFSTMDACKDQLHYQVVSEEYKVISIDETLGDYYVYVEIDEDNPWELLKCTKEQVWR